MIMKVTIKQVVECYKALGDATVSTLEESDKIKILKIRKVMRPMVEEYNAYVKDAEEKFKFEGIEEADKLRIGAINKWNKDHSYQFSEEEIEAAEKIGKFLESKSKAENEELSREVEIEFEKLSESAELRIMDENKWKIKKLEEIEIVL